MKTYTNIIFRGRELSRRITDREREKESDDKDRQREKEEIEELRNKVLESDAPDPTAFYQKVNILLFCI